MKTAWRIWRVILEYTIDPLLWPEHSHNYKAQQAGGGIRRYT